MSGFVSGVDFVVVATEDIERSEAFYRDVLGLQFGERWGNMPGVEYETGNLTLALMESKAIGLEFRPTPSGRSRCSVDDVAKRRAELEAKGVEFRGEILDSGVCHQAFFGDPDGNAPDPAPPLRGLAQALAGEAALVGAADPRRRGPCGPGGRPARSRAARPPGAAPACARRSARRCGGSPAASRDGTAWQPAVQARRSRRVAGGAHLGRRSCARA